MIEVKEEEIKSNELDAENEIPEELRETRWSVISFAKSESSGLTYTQAEQKIKELEAQKISGLCIVTDEVAMRMRQ